MKTSPRPTVYPLIIKVQKTRLSLSLRVASIRDEFYGKRKTIAGKEVGKVGTLRDLSQDPKKKLYISESLTQARKKLFGSINKFKKDNKWKYIWTNNGRIYLKQGDGEKRTFTFNYADELADFKSKFPLG
ncbi:unnamed protein product [Porites lobata]|uniref:FP protein C-terminal domain-containing protein n=1 Tax=Porites lobata TaxID=104759 RepID=A0ABN8S5S5_9CNID|nr:unnamed protein product [Porites lobata]